jgi:hypothetical protein
MLVRHHSEIVDRVKQPVSEAIVGHHKRQMHVAMLKAARQAQSAVFHKMHFDTAMAQLVPAKEYRKGIFNHHRCCSDTQNSSVPAFERPRASIEEIGLHEELAALPKQIFTL